MKKRYRWFCGLDKGCGKNRVICGCVSRQHKSKEDALRLAKVHEKKCGHSSIYIVEQSYESKTPDKKRYWFNGRTEYVGSKKIKIHNNIMYNYNWARLEYMGYKFAVILKDKIQPRSDIFLSNNEWYKIKSMNNRQIYNFCKSKHKRKHVFFSGMAYKDIDELRKDLLVHWLGGV